MRGRAEARERGAAASAGWLPLLLLALVPVAAAAARAPPPPKKLTWWKPQRYNKDGSLLKFNYQLSDEGTIAYRAGQQVYAIDFDTAFTELPKLKKKNPAAKFICYFSAGSWEDYRVALDKSRRGINATDWGAALGKPMDGWPGERWVDVRSAAVRRIMRKRLEYTKRIGCSGVDPDNVNGHDNNTGFKLTKRDLLAFNTWLANTSHALGLAIGLKNGGDMVPQLHPLFDWALNEECNVFDECDVYKAFAPSKPILGVEYCDAQAELGVDTLDPGCFCPRMLAAGYNWLFKRVALDAGAVSCARYCADNPAACAKRWPASCKAAKSNMCGLVPATPKL